MDFSSTEQTIGWFRDRYAEGNLILKPPYQRNPVWMARQKNYLVDSVLRGLPVPEVFIQRSTDETGATTYAVVDGQQRIRTLLQFVGSAETEDQVEFDEFALDKLDTSVEWYGQRFADLLTSQKVDFWGYELAVRYLNSTSDDDIKEMFRRLNRYTAPLKPQELRNATYSGPFARAANKLADQHSDFLAENRIITVGAIRRMADVEFIAELLIGVMHGPQSGSAGQIDEYYQEYEDYSDEFPGERRVRRTFERTLQTIADTLPRLRDLRWSNKTDFYTLFVVLAQVLPNDPLSATRIRQLRTALESFAADIETYLLVDDRGDVSVPVGGYVRNVQRAPNDKSRRVGRHSALLDVIQGVLPRQASGRR